MKNQLVILVLAALILLTAMQRLDATGCVQPSCDGKIADIGSAGATHPDHFLNPSTIRDSVRVPVASHNNPKAYLEPSVSYPYPVILDFDMAYSPETFVGDGYDFFEGSEYVKRAFYSIRVHPGYAGYTLKNVVFRVYQSRCYGNEQSHTFPIWEDGSTCYLILAQVQYPLPFTVEFFEPPIIQYLGAMSTDNTIGWRELDVTNAYQHALSNGWSDLQFMLFFPINSDWDGLHDYVVLNSPSHPHAHSHPHFILTYEKNASAEEDALIPNADSVTIYPNPISAKTTIKTTTDEAITDVQLYNIKGQRIRGVEFVHKSYSEGELDIKQQLPAGIYLLRCKVKSGLNESIVNKKVIIQ